MGGRMIRRLLDSGRMVSACDPSETALSGVVEYGAERANTPAEAAQGVDLVFCSLPDPVTLEVALTGADGVLTTASAGCVVVDVGTGDQRTAVRMSAACADVGVHFLDAPVSRGVRGAETGTLAMLVGGKGEVLERVMPIFSVLASDIVHVGAVGSGQVTKLCNNMLAAIHAAALGEVLVAGVRAGVDLEPLREAIAASSGASFVLSEYLPKGLFTEERPTGFALSLMRKDVGLFVNAGAQLGVALPISAIVQQQFVSAQAQGLDSADWTSVAEIYERSAGVRLVLQGGRPDVKP
jgi:3-hydroxyisobutyrate dehydrogenase-like beta-hydroxyacid dehydrogenase